MQGRGHLLEDDIQLCHLLRIGFAMISREDTVSISIFHLLQLARHEREQVSTERLGGLESNLLPSIHHGFRSHRSIRYSLPFGWHFQTERELRLQVRLLEAWENGAGTIRHQQGVKEFIVTIERLVARRKADIYFISSLCGSFFRYNQMLLFKTVVC